MIIETQTLVQLFPHGIPYSNKKQILSTYEKEVRI